MQHFFHIFVVFLYFFDVARLFYMDLCPHCSIILNRTIRDILLGFEVVQELKTAMQLYLYFQVPHCPAFVIETTGVFGSQISQQKLKIFYRRLSYDVFTGCLLYELLVCIEDVSIGGEQFFCREIDLVKIGMNLFILCDVLYEASEYLGQFIVQFSRLFVFLCHIGNDLREL